VNTIKVIDSIGDISPDEVYTIVFPEENEDGYRTFGKEDILGRWCIDDYEYFKYLKQNNIVPNSDDTTYGLVEINGFTTLAKITRR